MQPVRGSSELFLVVFPSESEAQKKPVENSHAQNKWQTAFERWHVGVSPVVDFESDLDQPVHAEAGGLVGSVMGRHARETATPRGKRGLILGSNFMGHMYDDYGYPRLRIYNGEERIEHYNQGRQCERWVHVAGTK